MMLKGGVKKLWDNLIVILMFSNVNWIYILLILLFIDDIFLVGVIIEVFINFDKWVVDNCYL